MSSSKLSTLLVSGTDSRMKVDAITKQNKYGCYLEPDIFNRSWSSCSSSTISKYCYNKLRERRKSAAQPQKWATSIRNRIISYLDIKFCSETHDLWLCPSGTDAEYLLSLAAAAQGKGRICNILVGSEETGTGSELAAKGLFFDPLLPFGSSRGSTKLNSNLIKRMDVKAIKVRNKNGKLKSPKVIAKEMSELLRSKSSLYIIHRLGCGKTGIAAPNFKFIQERICDLKGECLVVIDSAQGREDLKVIGKYLKAGCAVIFTGSKFFSGPSFSGCVFLPKKFSSALGKSPLKKNLSYYFSKADIPVAALRPHVKQKANLGLLYRWEGALIEMEQYFAFSKRVRYESARALCNQILNQIQKRRHLNLIEDQKHVHKSLAPIVSFTINGPENRLLCASKLKVLHSYLASPDKVSRETYTLGMPVALSEQVGVIRIAVSSRQISELCSGQRSKASFDKELGQIFKKIDRFIFKMAQEEELKVNY